MGKKLSLAAVVFALFAAFLAGCGSPSYTAERPSHAVGRTSSNPNIVGLKVHGEWRIEVRQPDGRLVRSLEFHNDLTYIGKSVLANVLAKTYTPGYWIVELFGSPDPCVSGGYPAACDITEPQGNGASGRVSKNLVVSTLSDGVRL